MQLWQILIVGCLLWISGALFSLGILGMGRAPASRRRESFSGRTDKRPGANFFSSTRPGVLVMCGVLGLAFAWAVAILLKEASSTSMWTFTMGTLWRR